MALVLSVLTAPAVPVHERLCDAAREDCRAPLLDLIGHEAVGIDVAFQVMSDPAIVDALVRSARTGVPVRVLTDAQPVDASDAETRARLREARIVVRAMASIAPLVPETMIFAGQRVVQFGGGGYAASSFAPGPASTGSAAGIYFVDDPVVVDRLMLLFDDTWMAGTDGPDAVRGAPAPVRHYPFLAVEPRPWAEAHGDIVSQLTGHAVTEGLGIDAIISRLSDPRRADALLAARERGVRVRLVTDAAPYRDPADPWHARNVERLVGAGVEVRLLAGAAHAHGALVLLHGQGTILFDASPWTPPSGERPHGYGYVTDSGTIYAQAVVHFARVWDSRGVVADTMPLATHADTPRARRSPGVRGGAAGDPARARAVRRVRVPAAASAGVDRDHPEGPFGESGVVVAADGTLICGVTACGADSWALPWATGGLADGGTPLPAWKEGHAAIVVGPDGTLICVIAACGAGGGNASELDGTHGGDDRPAVGETYPGREPGAVWRTRALERIERIRKSDIALTVVDASGDPVTGAEVRLRMTRHRFGFGSAVSAFDLTGSTADSAAYRGVIERSFNKVVLENDLKWRNWTRIGHSFYSRERTDAALDWVARRGIDVRGHYVVWGRRTGDVRIDRLEPLGAEAFEASLLRDAHELVTTIGARVVEWDVVNHPNGRGEGTLLDVLGPEFYDRVFARVAEWQPGVRRYLNEGDVLSATRINRDRYYQLIERMLARNAPVQGIGIMGHFFSDAELVSPEELLQVFDRYASFGLPLQVTEFDVWSRDEALQADFTRDFLIAAFSHPALEGIVMWGFWEGRHWHPPAALYRRDWSIKPNGLAWEQLVLRDWRTEVQGATDARGTYVARGFHGAYDVELRHDGRTVTCRLDLAPATFRGRIALGASGSGSPVAASAEGGAFECTAPVALTPARP